MWHLGAPRCELIGVHCYPCISVAIYMKDVDISDVVFVCGGRFFMYVFMVSGISLLMFIIHYVYTTTVRKVSVCSQ